MLEGTQKQHNHAYIEGKGNKQEIDGRIAQIRMNIENTTSDYDKDTTEVKVLRANARAVIRGIA